MTPPAGTSSKGLFSQDDYLAPLPIPGVNGVRVIDFRVNGVRDIDLNIDPLKSIALTPLIYLRVNTPRNHIDNHRK